MSTPRSSKPSAISSFSNSSSTGGHDPPTTKHPPSTAPLLKPPGPTFPITLNFEDYIESLAKQSETQPEQVSSQRPSPSPPSEPRNRHGPFHVHESLQPLDIAPSYTSRKRSVVDSGIPRPKRRPDSYPGRVISGNATTELDMAPKRRWYPVSAQKEESAPVLNKTSTPAENKNLNPAPMKTSTPAENKNLTLAQKKTSTPAPKLAEDSTPKKTSTPQPSTSGQQHTQIPKRTVIAVHTKTYTIPPLRKDQDSSADEASPSDMTTFQQIQSSNSSSTLTSSKIPEKSSPSLFMQHVSKTESAGPSQSSSDVQSSSSPSQKPSKRTRRTQNRRRRREAEMEAANASTTTDTEAEATPQHQIGQSSTFIDSTNGRVVESPATAERKLSKARRSRIDQSDSNAQVDAGEAADMESEADGGDFEYNVAEESLVMDSELEATQSTPRGPDQGSRHGDIAAEVHKGTAPAESNQETPAAEGQQETPATDGPEETPGAGGSQEASAPEDVQKTASAEDSARQEAQNEARLIDEQRRKCEGEKETLREELKQQHRHRCEEEKAALRHSLEEKAAEEHRQCEEEKLALKQELEAKAAEEKAALKQELEKITAEEHQRSEEAKIALKESLEIQAAKGNAALKQSLEKAAAEDRQRYESENQALKGVLESKAAEERVASEKAVKVAGKAEADTRKELSALLEGKEREYQAAKQTFEDERTKLETHGKELGDRFTQEKNEFEDQLSSLNEKFESSMKDIELLESHKQWADRDIAAANAELAERKEEVDRLKKELDNITAESEGGAANRIELETRHNDTTTELREIRRQLQECESHRREAAVTSELTQQELDRAKAELSTLADQKKEKDALQQAFDVRAAEHEALLIQLETLEREHRGLYRSLRDPTAVMNMQSITSAAAGLHESLDTELGELNSDSDEGESAQPTDGRNVRFAEGTKKPTKHSNTYKTASKSAKDNLSEAVQRDLRHHRAHIEGLDKQTSIEEELPFGPTDEKRIRKHIASTPTLVFRDNHDYFKVNDSFQLDDDNLRIQKDHIERIVNRQMQILGKIFALGKRLGALEASKSVERIERVVVPSMERNAFKWWLQPYIDLKDYLKLRAAKRDLPRRRRQKGPTLQKSESDIKKQEELLPPFQDVLNLLLIHLALYLILAFLVYFFLSVRKEAQIWKAANAITQQYLVLLREQSSNSCVDRPALIWQFFPNSKPDWVTGLWFDFIRYLNVERSLVG
jgi:hypothetical protein